MSQPDNRDSRETAEPGPGPGPGSDRDRLHMRRCIELALTAEGRTAPNPIVGAVVLDQKGNVVGEGFHKKAGTAHAEVHALNQAGDAARDGTLYVNLEPCCHHGKTPPCSERVIASGVKRVVVGCADTNPVVDGGGIKSLEEAGIEVTVNVLEEECRFINRGFFKRIATGLPWVALKLAVTLDGRIADRSGSSKWISCRESRQRVHELRNRLDSVLVGTNTLRRDNPELTVRKVPDGRNPVRIAIDANLDLSAEAKFCAVPNLSKTLIYARRSAIAERARQYPEHVTLIAAHFDESGQVDLAAVLRDLVASHRLNTLLVEGGGRLAGSLLQAGLVDELHWIVAPKLLVDQKAVLALSGQNQMLLDQCVYLKVLETSLCGDDIWIHALVEQ